MDVYIGAWKARRDNPASTAVAENSLHDFIASQIGQPGGEYYNDSLFGGTAWVVKDTVAMQVPTGSGVTNFALVLRDAVTELSRGDGVFQPPFDNNHGLQLRFTRDGDGVRLNRLEVGLPGPEEIEATWQEFVEAVEVFKHWHMAEHVLEAPWLLVVPMVQEWRAEAGIED